jgi:uncharacterized membrane protein
MKSKIMKVVILFLVFVIAIDVYVLLTNDNEKYKNEYTIDSNTDELTKELNEITEKNKDKIERYEKIVKWNRNIIDILK